MSIWDYLHKETPSIWLENRIRAMYCFDDLPTGSASHSGTWTKDIERIATEMKFSYRFCKTAMETRRSLEYDWKLLSVGELKLLYACGSCGWWFYIDRYGDSSWKPDIFADETKIDNESMPMAPECYGILNIGVVEAQLKKLDPILDQQPVEEIKKYLLAKNESRFILHPRRFEEVVGSAFRDAGFDVLVTHYSRDGGLDAILTDTSGVKVGVQVKRYRDAIEIAQIRELLGALVLNNMTRGVFVTTSRFQNGAEKLCLDSRKAGYEIMLIDGQRFLEALAVPKRNCFTSIEDFEDTFPQLKTYTVGHMCAPLVGA